MTDFSFQFRDQTIRGNAYGSDYLAEFGTAIDRWSNNAPDRVLEWGSGLTSLLLIERCKRWNSQLFLTLDTFKEYQDAVFRGVEDAPFLRFVTMDQMGPTRHQRDPELNYSTFPLSLGVPFDLIFIDGRRRMECAYIAALLSHRDTLIILHDYRRRRYQPVLGVYDVLEDGNQFRVLRLREDLVDAMTKSRNQVFTAMNGELQR